MCLAVILSGAAHATVSLKRISARKIVETDKQDGAVHYQLRMTVRSDGKSMQVKETDRERGTETSYVMEKNLSERGFLEIRIKSIPVP